MSEDIPLRAHERAEGFPGDCGVSASSELVESLLVGRGGGTVSTVESVEASLGDSRWGLRVGFANSAPVGPNAHSRPATDSLNTATAESTAVQACCFDMDGVLVDSEDAWVARERGELLPRVVPDDTVTLAEITGMNYRDIYDYLAAEYDVAMTKADFVAWYDDAAETVYGEQVSLLPGAAALVDDLRAASVPVALVSSSPLAWIDTVLERFDLAFDAVVSGDDFDGPGKPDPALYRRAADRLGVAPGDAVAVEDSVHGIEAARGAGMTVVGFRFGDDEGTDFADAHLVPAGPEELVASLRELADLA